MYYDLQLERLYTAFQVYTNIEINYLTPKRMKSQIFSKYFASEFQPGVNI